MSEIVFTRDLLSQLMDARDALVAYLQRRRAQGNMAVSDNDRLRDSCFLLARQIRGQGEKLNQLADNEARIAIHHAEEALSSAALCLMSGSYDCPTYIAVNVVRLERSLDALNDSIGCLNAYLPHTKA